MRLSTILILYLAQGIPIGLLEFAIPAWMAASGATAGEIGYVIGMAAIPWSLKFVNGALMDRYAYLPMGRRRAWLIGSQVVMITSLLLCALLEPGPRDEVLLGAIAFIVSLAVVFQDVAADALAVDICDKGERGYAGGIMAGGQALGIAITASIAGLIIYQFGVGAGYVSAAIVIIFITAYLVWVRERTGERRLPWSDGSASPDSVAIQADSWVELLKGAFRYLFRRDSLIWSGSIFLRGLGYGTMAVAVPLIAANYAGWNEAQIGAANGTAQLVSAIAAITLGGWLCSRLGAKQFQILTYALFAVAIGAFALLESFWAEAWMIWVIAVGWTVLYNLVGTGNGAINMAFCDPKTGATQFSIYMAFVNQGTSFAGFTFALLAGFGGLQAPLFFLAIGILVATALTLLITVPSHRDAPHAEQPEIAPA
ncbi:MFS transporter [Aurantiacibacter sp. MUD11]|nr:MFS transporter [Aurantiacibacter sp. MUD11]WAT16741.1 MFS transporter [Aurantiacibacter sp. MUD11]